jgi:hypothetical protein
MFETKRAFFLKLVKFVDQPIKKKHAHLVLLHHFLVALLQTSQDTIF